MAFIKEVTIYEKGEVKVYIHQCHNLGKKTKLYAIRKNDKTGLAHILGTIKWHGAWRQYVFFPEMICQTFWSAGCLRGIEDFLIKINQRKR